MRVFYFILCSLVLSSVGARANVALEGTRIIYPADDKVITVKMHNEGSEPSLMQLWVDSGDPAVQPQNSDAPFLITPPIFRLEPNKGQSVRLMFTGKKLPQDRETLFWFNALEIPPVSTNVERSSMQIALRSRLKLFFRPANLPGDAASAPKKVVWQLVPISQGKGYSLLAKNPGPYYVTYSKLMLLVEGERYDLGAVMIEPFNQVNVIAKGLNNNSPNKKLTYRAMNDYGVSVEEVISVR